jgi:hypothetical protein
MKVYHRTTSASAEAILRDGFSSVQTADYEYLTDQNLGTGFQTSIYLTSLTFEQKLFG